MKFGETASMGFTFYAVLFLFSYRTSALLDKFSVVDSSKLRRMFLARRTNTEVSPYVEATPAGSCLAITDMAKSDGAQYSDEHQDNLTVSGCYAMCKEQRTIYFATQGGNRCACFDKYTPEEGVDAVCDQPCSGKESELCGGTAHSHFMVRLVWAWVGDFVDRPCGAPPVVADAAESCSSGGSGVRGCNITCAPGYRLAENTLVCDTLRGNWVGSAKCLEVKCGAPLAVEHAVSLCESSSASANGGKCEVTCQPGYELVENSLRCVTPESPEITIGFYSGRAYCKAKECGVPPERGGASALSVVVPYPTVVTYTCVDGFRVGGDPAGVAAYTTRCQEDGSFAPMTEECKPVTCGAPPAIPGAMLGPDEVTGRVLSTVSYLSVARYQCEKGFSLDGTSNGVKAFQVPCEARGNFANFDRCLPIGCGLVVPVQFAEVLNQDVAMELTYDSVVKYRCRPGYSLDASSPQAVNFEARCDENGFFSGVQVCRPIRCGTPPVVKNAMAPQAHTFFSERVPYTCEVGHTLTGDIGGNTSFVRECGADGQFSPPPECLPVSCGLPPLINNSAVLGSLPHDKGLVYNEVVTYRCAEGYSTDRTHNEGSGGFSMICLENGQFSGGRTCEDVDDCAGHNCGPFGECVDLLMNYTCECTSGYNVHKDNISGELLCGNIDDCGPQACGMGGTCRDLLNDYTCDCEAGFELIVGEGEKPDKVCKPVECGLGPIVENALEPNSKAAFGGKIEYHCNTGYSIDGNASGATSFFLECLASKSFSQAQACKPIGCGLPPSVEHARFPGNSLNYPAIVTYTCDTGYTTDGSAKGNHSFDVQCLATGHYSAAGACRPVTCGRAPVVNSATTTSEASLTFGQVANYTCRKGHALTASDPSQKYFEAVCRADGTYEGVKACEPVSCSLPLAGPLGVASIATTFYDLFRRSPDGKDPCQHFCGQEISNQCESIHTVEQCRHSYMWKGSQGSWQGSIVPCQWNGSSCGSLNGGDHVFGCLEPARFCPSNRPQDSYCTSGVSDGTVCCPQSCGQCGGRSCEQAEGGNANCCSAHIMRSNRMCNTSVDVGCVLPREGATATSSDAKVDFLTQVTYRCAEGYTLTGDVAGSNNFIASCTAEGQLSGLLDCGRVRAVQSPPVIAHAVRNNPGGALSDQLFAFDKVSYTCEAGFAVSFAIGEVGPVPPANNSIATTTFVLEVLPSGLFSAPPVCLNIDDCVSHSCGAHGVCVDDIMDYNCRCDPGFELQVLENGDKMCGNKDDCAPEECGSHGTCIDLISDYTCECQLGYEMVNKTSLTGPLAVKVCEAVVCPELPAVSHSGLRERMTLSYPHVVEARCDEGYSVDGTASPASSRFVVSCQAEGILTPVSTCHPVECGAAPLVQLAASSPPVDKTFVFGELATYTCQEGYSLTGFASGNTSVSLPCRAEGTFPPAPVCRPVSCGPPPLVSRAATTVGEVKFPGSASYECEVGYALQADSRLSNRFEYKCTSSGNYLFVPPNSPMGSTEAVQCVKTTCGEAPTYLNAKNVPGRRLYQDVVEYTCAEGYSVDGTTQGARAWSIVCRASGEFSNPAATTCLPVTFDVAGLIRDATNLNPVRNAVVSISSAGFETQATTDINGMFRASRVPMGSVSLNVTSAGFIGSTKSFGVDANIVPGSQADLTLSPLLPPDGWRVVLQWDNQPRDLDSDLKFGSSQACRLYYNAKTLECMGVKASLDVDDVDGYGPETITLTGVGTGCNKQAGECKFVYRVINYSRNPEMKTSNAIVRLYRGETQVGEYKLKPNAGDGVVKDLDRPTWAVFSINGKTGEVRVCQNIECV